MTDHTLEPNFHATEGLNQSLLEKWIVFCLGNFYREGVKCTSIPNATLEPYSESQVKESPEAPQEKVWYHVKHTRF